MNSSLPPKEFFPRHIGIIMDGNGRWATQKGLPRSEGHKAGAKVFKKITEYAVDLGIESLTYYAFSTENWRRPPEEVTALMALFREYLEEAEDRKLENEKKGMRIRFIGETDTLPEDIAHRMETTEQESAGKNAAIVNIAISYGGRQEILHSVREIARQVASGALSPEEITQEHIESHLYTEGQPELDLIIRPSGEKRLSNFMVWQSAYAEFWYSDVLWPDFTEQDFNRAIWDFAKRNRRFGGV
ncbi:MAG: di-trans,poly-cis-decaprenylcistransferase [Oscillospiraceae bacterium]|nr:di-trans,poly-cis-decaprenylcistransferase [Oscillospiraceae bacterium]